MNCFRVISLSSILKNEIKLHGKGCKVYKLKKLYITIEEGVTQPTINGCHTIRSSHKY